MKSILKKYWFIGLVVIFLYPAVSSAQGKFEITPFGGYMFGGKLRTYQGDLKIDDNANYGLLVDIAIAKDQKFEFFWSQMQSYAEFKPYYGYEELRAGFDVNINYYQIGTVREVNMDKIRPFGAFTLGAVYFNPKDIVHQGNNPQDYQLQDSWRFSVSLGGGAKIWLSDRIGVRLQGRLLMPLYFQGVSMYAGIGTGGASTGISVGAGVPILQGDLTAGLIIALGD